MKRYILAGLIVFVIVLVVSFPARVAYNWFTPPGINLTGISGSVWNGSADEGLASGAYFRELTWKMKPLSLLSGQAAFEIAAKPAGGSIATEVAVSPDGSLELSNFVGNIPLNLIHQSFQQEGIHGDVSLDFSQLIVRNGVPEVINGAITVSNFLSPQLSPDPLGDYRATFQNSGDAVEAIVEDLSGALDVEGELRISPDRSYSFVGGVGTTADASPDIASKLTFLGSPDERGLREFRFEGSL